MNIKFEKNISEAEPNRTNSDFQSVRLNRTMGSSGRNRTPKNRLAPPFKGAGQFEGRLLPRGPQACSGRMFANSQHGSVPDGLS